MRDRSDKLLARLSAKAEERPTLEKFAPSFGVSPKELADLRGAKAAVLKQLSRAKLQLRSLRFRRSRTEEFLSVSKPQVPDPKPCPDLPVDAGGSGDREGDQETQGAERTLSELGAEWEARVAEYQAAIARLKRDIERATRSAHTFGERVAAVQAANKGLRETLIPRTFLGLRVGQSVRSAEEAAADCESLLCSGSAPNRADEGLDASCLERARSAVDEAVAEMGSLAAGVEEVRGALGEVALQLSFKNLDLAAADLGALLDGALAATVGGDPEGWLRAQRAFRERILSSLTSLEASLRQAAERGSRSADDLHGKTSWRKALTDTEFIYAERVYALAKQAQAGLGAGGERLRDVRGAVESAYLEAESLQKTARAFLESYRDAETLLESIRQRLAAGRDCATGDGGRRPEDPPMAEPAVPEVDPDGRIRVPRVIDRSRDEAKVLLGNAGFSPFVFELELSPSKEFDLVVTHQDPAPNALAEPGTVVHVGYNTPHDYMPELDLDPAEATGSEEDDPLPGLDPPPGEGLGPGDVSPDFSGSSGSGSTEETGPGSGVFGQDDVIEEPAESAEAAPGAWDEAADGGSRETISDNAPGVEQPSRPPPAASRDDPGSDDVDRARQIAAEAAVDRQRNMSKPNWAESLLGPMIDINRTVTGGGTPAPPRRPPSTGSTGGGAGTPVPASGSGSTGRPAGGGRCHFQNLTIGNAAHFVVVHPKPPITNYVIWSLPPPDGEVCSTPTDCMQQIVAKQIPGSRIHGPYRSRSAADEAARALCARQSTGR